MRLTYGMLKCKIASNPQLKATRRKRETQYHLHATLAIVADDGSTTQWDSAINVGTNDADDLLKYKLIFDFQHGMLDQLRGAPQGFSDLTDTETLPSLDFLRSDVLANTGPWRDSDPMDGSEEVEPVASLLRLLKTAKANQSDVWVFGRKYTDGDGIHDVHMNQGSGAPFLNDGQDNHNDHNDVWQDGGVIVDVGKQEFAAYFTTFTQQLVPTDDLGNPEDGAHAVEVEDDGSLADATLANHP
ncbi:MAG TPA: DUF2278 family protein [Candidatus Angelobacter sp.]|nr:DUF2278 family protein [Candidatus Angelobacter sp.]